MPEIKHETKVTTVTEHTVTITKNDLLRWLKRREGLDPKDQSVRVTIQVPRGGDYSGDILDLDDIGGVTVYWLERTQE